ncbi:MAG: hypothetical protein ACTHU0_22375 [Kofleriaceae bacterium]
MHRARYLASSTCADIYYRLEYPNGGHDPKATDPASRWTKPGSTFVNRTADCIAAAAWCGGWDRYQPTRFAHLYEGSINCDSMRYDAGGPAKCFERLDSPRPGCMVVYGSVDYDHDRRWDRRGHIGTVVEVPARWDPKSHEAWRRLVVVDIADRSPHRANRATTGVSWFGRERRGVPRDSWFVRSVMTP